MNPAEHQRWLELCRRAAVEQDPRKLLTLAEKISRFSPEDESGNDGEDRTDAEPS
jgi:hypothetical protein